MMMLANVKMAVSTHSICLTSKLEHLQFGALFNFTLQARHGVLVTVVDFVVTEFTMLYSAHDNRISELTIEKRNLPVQ